MRRHSRLRALGVGLLAAGLTLGSGLPVSASRPGGAPPARPDVSVTLLTGDRVILAGGDSSRATIVPAEAGKSTTFRRYVLDGRLHVIPSDLFPHVAADRLDRRLFDITGLIKAGYDDRHSKRIPLIVSYRGTGARDKLTTAGATVTRSLPAIQGAAVEVDRAKAPEFLAGIPKTEDGFANGIDRIWLDDPLEAVAPIGVDGEAEVYTLTLKGIDRNGDPARFGGMIRDLSTGLADFYEDEDGTVQVQLPAGRYLLDGFVHEADTEESSILVQPVLTLDRDTTWTADARLAKPISQTVQNRDVRPALIDLSFELDGRFPASIWAFEFDGLRTAHVGPEVPEFDAILSVDWGVPGADGEFHNSPEIYKVVEHRSGRFWDGYQRSVRDRELATVTQQFNAQVAKRSAYTVIFGHPAGTNGSSSAQWTFDLPAKPVVRMSAGDVEWRQQFSEYVIDPESGWDVPVTWLSSGLSTYEPGKQYAERWNAAVFGPASAGAERYGDLLFFGAAMYSDPHGHYGSSYNDSASTTLYRDGEKVAESGAAGGVEVEGLPPEAAEFVVETTAERPAYSDFSTKVTARWTFRSAATDPEEGAEYAAWTAQFAPRVDAHNRSHDDGLAYVPMRLTSRSGADLGEIDRIEVKVSTDDGQTWQRARLKPAGDNRYLVAVSHPEQGFVSFQVSAADDRQNAVEQTIIRAYALG